MTFSGVTGAANVATSFLNQFHTSLSSIATIQTATTTTAPFNQFN